MLPTQNTGIYFHIPFCRSKCPYCDFYSLRRAELAEPYTDAVKNELLTLSRLSPFVSESVRAETVDSVYFGGGTPSVLGAKKIADILSTARDGFGISENAELTVEVNPSLDDPAGFFAELKAAGVNRVSMGLQSAVDCERRALGRIASAKDAEFAVKSAKKAGITDISLDVMLGIPMQTEKSLLYTLDFALSLEVTHMSCYMLQLEEGTVFYDRRDKLALPDEDAVADMYLLMCSHLRQNGMRRYEISNFCFGDNQSRHNTKYWTLAPYIGIGASAHSYYGGKRFYFDRDISSFINGKKAVFDCLGGDGEEKLMLALRTDAGVASEELPSDKLKTAHEFEKAGLLQNINGRLSLTDKGCLVSNSVISELI